MAGIRDVALPVSTANWLTWGNNLDTEVRSRSSNARSGGEENAGTFPGANDTAKHVAANAYAAAQTKVPCLRYAGTWNLTGTMIPYPSMSWRGYGAGQHHSIETDAQSAPTLLRWYGGLGTSSMINGAGLTVFGIHIGEMALWETSGAGQFVHWPYGGGNVMWGARFGDIMFYGFRRIFGQAGTPAAVDFMSWYGDWNIIGSNAEQVITLGGSDNFLTPTGMNGGGAIAAADSYWMEFSSMSKSFVSNLYLTQYLGGGGIIKLTGNNGLNFTNCVLEGALDGQPAPGNLIMQTSGTTSWTNIHLNYAMANPTVGSPDFGAYADIRGGWANFDNVYVKKASAVAQSVPVIRNSGTGKVFVNRIMPQIPGEWSNSLMLCTNTGGGTLVTDAATVRTS